MMKLLRKYNKQLLAVTMVFLMIVFIGGTALESLMTPSFNPIVANSNLGKISQRDTAYADQSTRLLQSLGIPWQAYFTVGSEPLTQTDWVLLLREAERLGIKADVTAARVWLNNLQDSQAIDRVAIRLGIKPARMYQAVAEFQVIERTIRFLGSASPPSATAVRVAAKNALDKVKVQAVVFPATAFLDESQEFPEVALSTLLDTARETEAGKGLNFGYYVPTALRVQYIRIDRDKLAKQIGVPNLERRAREHYNKNRDSSTYKRESDGSEPDDQLGPLPPTYLTWDEAKETAVDIVRKQHADEIAGRIAMWLVDYTLEGFFDVESGDDGYKPAPDFVKRPEYYQEIISKLPAKLSYPDAISVEFTDFFTADSAENVPDIGVAYRDGQSWLGSLKTLAVKTKAVVAKVPDDAGVRTDEYISDFQTSLYPLTDADGNKFIFRVVDSKAAHPAESIDEVRDQLITDLRLKKAYEQAYIMADTLKCAADEQGLKPAFDTDEELQELSTNTTGPDRIGFFEPPTFSRVSRARAAEQFSGDATQYVSGLGQIPSASIARCFDLESAEHPTTIIELPDRATVIVVQWLETQTADEDDFNSLKTTLVSQLSSNERRKLVNHWLDPEQIRARNGYEMISR